MRLVVGVKCRSEVGEHNAANPIGNTTGTQAHTQAQTYTHPGAHIFLFRQRTRQCTKGERGGRVDGSEWVVGDGWVGMI